MNKQQLQRLQALTDRSNAEDDRITSITFNDIGADMETISKETILFYGHPDFKGVENE